MTPARCETWQRPACQGEAWWSLVRQKAAQRTAAETRARAVWRGLGGIACAPAGRRGAALVGGQRDQAHARVRRTRWHAVRWGLLAFFPRAQLPHAAHAWVPVDGMPEVIRPLPGKRGPTPPPPPRPPADGPSAQGVKRRTGGRVVAGTTTSICGAGAAVHARGGTAAK